MDLSNLDIPIKTNNKVPDKFKHELGSRIIEEFIDLTRKTYSFKDSPKNTKEKERKKHNNAKHEEFYDALMNNTQRTVDECRIQKVGDSMTTTKTGKISLNIFDDRRFYVNSIKSYPQDKELYLFERDLINRIQEAASPIKKLYKDKDLRSSFIIKDKDKDKDVDKLIIDIKELTIDSNRKLIEAAIILFNALSAKQFH